MSRLDTGRQEELEPKRMEYAFEQINKAGYEILKSDKTSLEFEFKGEKVKLFVYSGWFTGKSVKDDRGIHKLIKQISDGKLGGNIKG